MNTLELFLVDASGEDVEATHQRILAWLLRSETIVKGLLGLEIKAPFTRLEVHKKLFDIQINDDGGERALIEIKMWSSLSINQQRRQQDAANAPLYYFLFGISGLERIPDKEKTLNMSSVAERLRNLTEKAVLIAKELDVNDAVSITKFITTYANRLDAVNEWLIDKAWKPGHNISATKSSHYASLFYHLKERIEKKYSKKFNMPIYRTEKGQNVTLEINHFNKLGKDTNRSISIAGINGKLIFWIKNEHMEIFFNGDAKVYPNDTTRIRDSFNALWSSKTNLFTGKKLRITGKKGTKWLCLLRVELFAESINCLEQLGEIANEMTRYYNAFSEVQNVLRN